MTSRVIAVPCPPSQIGPEVSAVIVTIVINIIPASQHHMDQAGFKSLVCKVFYICNYIKLIGERKPFVSRRQHFISSVTICWPKVCITLC